MHKSYEGLNVKYILLKKLQFFHPSNEPLLCFMSNTEQGITTLQLNYSAREKFVSKEEAITTPTWPTLIPYPQAHNAGGRQTKA